MRILLVTPYFAPENTIAAVRLTKFAAHWSEAGHDVVVLTRKVTETGGLVVPRGVEVVRVTDPTLSIHRAAVGGRYEEKRGRGILALPRQMVGWVARRLSPWPDRFVPWTFAARRAVTQRPDVVVASGGPLSALMLGRRLARRFDVPWVADYRDLLSTGDYLRRSPVRRGIERVMERRAVRTAAALLTVSEPMSRELERFSGVPATTVLNGFDPEDFPEMSTSPDERLRILYCGEIYPGKRDPGPLFAGMALLPPEERALVAVDFYGASVDDVMRLATEHRVGRCVHTHARVPYRAALELQCSSDLLLSLLWDDPREGGVYSGKLFEYIGASRPILALGWEQGVAARLVRERSLGLASNDPAEIAHFLRRLLATKKSGALVAWTHSAAVEDLTRREQSHKAMEVLAAVLDQPAGRRET